MQNILIAYSTSEGQTLKIAEHVAELLRERETIVDMADVTTLKHATHLGDYDAVILGASIHIGKHQRSMARFITRNRDWLARIPSVFFSVSLTSATDDADHRKLADEMANTFLSEVNWMPDRIWLVAGALQYRKYSPLKRFLMKKISASQDGETDTSRNHEYTDWEKVDEMVAEFAGLIESRISQAVA